MTKSRKSKDLEIPLGKRTPFYRFFEMVPALLSYGTIGLLLVLSYVSPPLATAYVLVLIATLLVKASLIAVDMIKGHQKLQRAQAIDWRERLEELSHPARSLKLFDRVTPLADDEHIHREHLESIIANPEEYPKPREITQLVIMAAYNEPYEVIEPSIHALAETTYDKRQMIVVFAYEERGGASIRETAQRLEREYRDTFGGFYLVEHPDGLPNEVVGKGGNITYAAETIVPKLVKKGLDVTNTLVTTVDCDNKVHPAYFDYLSYEFIVQKDRQNLSYQPIALYFGNIWDAPAPMRVIATGNSFWTIISSMRPHMLRNFAAHSQPLAPLRDMGYWSTRTIVEDGHQYWRSYFHFDGTYDVIPLHVPVYQDAVLADGFKKTLIAQFKQLRRWGYGASDVPYVAERLFTNRRTVPFFEGLARFIRLLDSHVSLATISILVAVGGWVPLLLNPDASREIAAHNLPEAVSLMQRIAMIGLVITIGMSIKMLPPRPERYKRTRTLGMVLQWFLMPVTAIGYSALSSIVAQTHLLLGKYLDTFDVTEKTTRETRRDEH